MAKTKREKRDEALTMIITSQLPEDSIHEIFLGLSIKSLLRFQLVSKQWHSLIFNPVFTKSHLQFTRCSNTKNSQPVNTLLIHSDNSLDFLKFDASSKAENTKCGNLDVEIPSAPSVPWREYAPLGSCDGLVCLYDKFSQMITVWNPTTKQCRQILRPPSMNYSVVMASGFGFVPSINDCKIVLVSRDDKRGEVITRSKVNRLCWKVCVYTMRNDEWRQLKTSSSSFGDIVFVDKHDVSVAVLLNEALHWVVHCPHKGLRSYSMLKFDLVKEEFEELNVVAEEKLSPPYYKCFTSIGIVEPNNLCMCQLVQFQVTVYVKLWVLEQYGEWDSWKKMFAFAFGFNKVIQSCLNFYLMGIASSGNVLINTSYRGLVSVNASCDRLIRVHDKENPQIRIDCHNSTYVVNYVPSLTSPRYYFG